MCQASADPSDLFEIAREVVLAALPDALAIYVFGDGVRLALSPDLKSLGHSAHTGRSVRESVPTKYPVDLCDRSGSSAGNPSALVRLLSARRSGR